MSELLTIQALAAGYGGAQVLSDISLNLETGKSLAVLGRNGAGKTTLLDSIIGVTTYMSGSIHVSGRDITGLSPENRAASGIGWVPQERNIFRSLSVEENLTVTARRGEWTLQRIYAFFPRLQERRRNMGDALSGGEQQMLAIGRALMLNPRLLLLDEPLEGLAPVIADEVMAGLGQLVSGGLSVIVVEQKARKILPLTDYACVIDRGRMAWSGDSASLLQEDGLLDQLMALS